MSFLPVDHKGDLGD